MDFFASLLVSFFTTTSNAPEPEHESSTPIDADGLAGGNFTVLSRKRLFWAAFVGYYSPNANTIRRLAVSALRSHALWECLV
jgi:hypothetical protein